MDGDRLLSEYADPADVLALPPAARMRERLTKVMLADAAVDLGIESKIIDRAVDVASAVVGVIRPETVQVPPGRSGSDLVADIPVIHLVLAPKATSADQTKLIDLIHRGMPRPVIVFVTSPKGVDWISLALSHVSVSNAERSVIDARVFASLDQIVPGSLRLKVLDRADLATLYRDLTRVVAANGQPTVPGLSAEKIIQMRSELMALEADLATTVRAAQSERSQPGRIALNTRARELRDRIQTVGAALYNPVPSQ